MIRETADKEPTPVRPRRVRKHQMKIGICLPHYGKAMEPNGMRRFAETAEALGFDSLWVTDHVILPRERDMLYKERMLEPLATLNFLAGVTSRITIGTSVIVL